MISAITFSPIIKYLIIFLLTFMFLNYNKVSPDQFMNLLVFIMIINIIFDILILDDFLNILSPDTDEKNEI